MDKHKNTPTFQQLIKHPTHFLAFGFGSGLINPAPGTWGSLVAAIIMLPFITFLQSPLPGSIFLVLTFFIGIYLCGKTARDIGVHDHSGIVWDEFVAVWYIMITFPPILWLHWGLVLSTLAAFLLFRLFDIWKPWPICEIDKRMRGGTGIMLDDIAAAIAADIVLYLISLAY